MAETIETVIRDDAGNTLKVFPQTFDKLDATANPGVADDGAHGFNYGSKWVNRTNGTVWFCTNNTDGAATWTQLSGGGGGGAPATAEYLVKSADGTLTAERVVQDSGFIAADWTAAAVVQFNIVAGSITTTQLGGDITAAGKALLDDANAAAQRTTLGLGTVATLASDTDATLAANSNANVATQAAVKSYVDNMVTGLNWKHSVRAATTANGTLATAYENGDTIDGVTLATGDRILIKNQTTQSENGIYVVNASGAPTRAADANIGAELVNATVLVEDGTANADTQWTCSNNQTPTLGTTAITFVQVSGAGTYTADGTTLQLSSNVFSVKTAGVTEAYLGLSDVTTGNVTTTAHGLAPKLPNDVSKFLNGIGTYTIPGGAHAIQLDVVSAAGTGTITIPAWATTLSAVVIGGGGGGGSGRVGVAASIRNGGGGGGPGGRSLGTFRVADLGGATALYYACGAGGAGGAANSGTSVNGTLGGSGGNSELRITNSSGVILLTAGGGASGFGGTNVNPTAGAIAGPGMFSNGTGGFCSTVGSQQGTTNYGGGPSGGGAGGGINAANAIVGNTTGDPTGGTTTTGLANSNLGGQGGAGGISLAGANAQAGTAGVGPGAGGGGSGGAQNTFTSPAAAAGNDGEIWLMWQA